jgi:hypothetical protein
LLPRWRQAIAIVQPDTLLRWHRAGFRLFWRLRSRPRGGSPLAKETIDLIRDMARRGRLWGAERIQGELLMVSRATPGLGRSQPGDSPACVGSAWSGSTRKVLRGT